MPRRYPAEQRERVTRVWPLIVSVSTRRRGPRPPGVGSETRRRGGDAPQVDRCRPRSTPGSAEGPAEPELAEIHRLKAGGAGPGGRQRDPQGGIGFLRRELDPRNR